MGAWFVAIAKAAGLEQVEITPIMMKRGGFRGWREKNNFRESRSVVVSAKVRGMAADVRVSLADKVNNAEDIVQDLRKEGAEVLSKFAGCKFGVLWYKALIEKFGQKGHPDLLSRLGVAVSLMEKMAA